MMSGTSRGVFKKDAALRAASLRKDERVLTCGLARNRVSGAGKHLRVADMVTQSRMEMRNAKNAFEAVLGTVGGPHNGGSFLAAMGVTRVTPSDVRRLSGWFNAVKHYPAAQKVVSLLCTKKGMGSPYQRVRDLFWFSRLWVTPKKVTWNQVRAIKWALGLNVDSKIFDFDAVSNAKLFTELGRISHAARWVVTGFNGDSRPLVTHRDLDWAALAKVQGTRAITKYLPERVKAWFSFELAGVPGTRQLVEKGFDPFSMRVATAKRLIAVYGDNLPEKVDAIYRVTLLFGADVAGALKFCGYDATQPEATMTGLLHDRAQCLPLYKLAPAWSQFVRKFVEHPKFHLVLSEHRKVEEVLGRVPASMNEVLTHFEEKGILLLSDTTEEEKAFCASNPSKGFEFCPQVKVVQGEYTLTKLAANDYRQVTAGRLVDCCQHLGGAGATCAMQAWTHGQCAIYAVFKGQQMVAQAFAWRGLGGELVFDSVEAKGGVNAPVVVSLFRQAAEQALGQLGVAKVLVGINTYGLSTEVGNGGKAIDTPRPDGFTLSYTDTRGGCIVICKTQKVKAIHRHALPVPESLAVLAVNTLSNDSDVYCEHCEAQVHPACVTCPSCGMDISEWV